ncbi:hypothetical protein MetMK1DRAFT_00006700 [Metallosphaera yellowstonensis MK1]|jgi:hypothetical protein|uniref:Uncharacterized protein n=2 Tax=Metallosphaera TaxID=41980 RepID=H2C1P7_9CREN|nr:hypothetical protein MetMK1DRAFT_00006700 [Metallosphaera yellowstonensis MK1]
MKETSFFVIETATLMDFLRTFRAPFRSLCSQCPGAVDCSSWFPLNFYAMTSTVLGGVVLDDLEHLHAYSWASHSSAL